MEIASITGNLTIRQEDVEIISECAKPNDKNGPMSRCVQFFCRVKGLLTN